MYRTWGYDALKDECKRRKIPLPNNFIKKNLLERKVLETKQWLGELRYLVIPLRKLRDECPSRGLPIRSEHLRNKYKRTETTRMDPLGIDCCAPCCTNKIGFVF